jgi:hypothetical protein
VLFLAIVGVSALVVALTQHWDALKVMAGQAIDYIMDKVNGLLAILTGVRDQFIAFFDMIAARGRALRDNMTTLGRFPPPRRPRSPAFRRSRTAAS